MGGAALHFGWVAEMKTGEGKTLVSTLPVYLNALAGKGVHQVTVNDYLASRDADWMGEVHRWLGLSVGLVVPGQNDSRFKREQYGCDITYGTNNEFGFDYLRDNMARTRDGMTQRGHAYAIVDEIDSILIDEARTPLIISGKVKGAADLYDRFSQIASRLERDVDYEVDEEKRLVTVTEDGINTVEAMLGIENLYDGVQGDLVHHLNQSLRAKELFKRDKDYLVADGEVKIVDEFTGRVLDGRRWSDGLHQAVESKESVRDQRRTADDGHRHPPELLPHVRQAGRHDGNGSLRCCRARDDVRAGGRADTHQRTDRQSGPARPDLQVRGGEVRRGGRRRCRAGPDWANRSSSARHRSRSPRRSAELFDERRIAHQVLNAKQHFREADVVAQAGAPGAVTVATNMAGRGVDIVLGGNPEKLAERDTRAEGFELGTEEGEAYYRKRFDYWTALCSEDGEKGATGGRVVCAREPNGTNPDESTTSSEVDPAARVIRGRAGST